MHCWITTRIAGEKEKKQAAGDLSGVY